MSDSKVDDKKEGKETEGKEMAVENSYLRVRSEYLDSILGVKFEVLDKGFVRVVDYMGTDASVVQAARVSYQEGTKRVHEDHGLIRYLMRHEHWTPFEMCELKIHIRIPMDAWRQFVRHRTASINETSTRYSIANLDKQQTLPQNWRIQSSSSKQGSKQVQGQVDKDGQVSMMTEYLDVDQGRVLSTKEHLLHDFAAHVYDERLVMGVAREQARKDLPLSTYTEAYWKMDLRNLLHFLRLRTDARAQEEIRSYANVMAERIVSGWVPITYGAWLDYQKNALILSVHEQEVLKRLVSDTSSVLDYARSIGWITYDGQKIVEDTPNRERDECKEKLARLGFVCPW